MNRITISDDILTELDDTIDVELDECREFFGVCKIIITPKCDSKLELVYNVDACFKFFNISFIIQSRCYS